MTRLSEFYEDIYFKNTSYLEKKLISTKPNVLIDIGANIGTASLKLKDSFPSLEKIIAIEADKRNYEILCMNFDYWATIFQSVSFSQYQAVASFKSNIKHSNITKIFDKSKLLSKSGALSFAEKKDGKLNSIGIDEIMKTIDRRSKVICKIDIEGGEEALFSKNTDWLKRISYFNIEIHDKYHPSYVNSSSNILKALVKYNFAIIPNGDLLYCFNRNLLSL